MRGGGAVPALAPVPQRGRVPVAEVGLTRAGGMSAPRPEQRRVAVERGLAQTACPPVRQESFVGLGQRHAALSRHGSARWPEAGTVAYAIGMASRAPSPGAQTGTIPRAASRNFRNAARGSEAMSRGTLSLSRSGSAGGRASHASR